MRFMLRALCPLMFAVTLAGLVGAQSPEEQSQIDFANGLVKRGMNDEAAEEYRNYLKRFPAGVFRDEALYWLGEAEFALKRYDKALEAFDSLLKSGGGEYGERARLKRGITLAQAIRYEDAIATLKPIALAEPASKSTAPALYHLGKAYYGAGQSRNAIGAFERLIDLPGSHTYRAYANFQLATMLLKDNTFDKAAIAFSEVANDESAEPALRMEGRFRAAELYDKLGWFDAALQAYEDLRREFPDSEYATRASYGYTWSLYHAGKFSPALEAAEEFEKAYPESPNLAGVVYLRGNALQQLERPEDAMAAYRRVREQWPDSPFAERASLKEAWALYAAGQSDEARRIAEEYLARHASGSAAGEASFLVATILERAGDCAGAYPYFRRVVTQFAESDFAPDALYKSAECLDRLGNVLEAAAAYERFASLYPGHTLTLKAVMRAGDAHFAGGNFGAARDTYERVTNETSSKAVGEEARYRLAITLLNLDKPTEADTNFRNLLEKFPESVYAQEAQLRIANYLLKDKKSPLEAIEFYRTAYDADPDGTYAAEALKGIALARLEAQDVEGAAKELVRLMEMQHSAGLSQETHAWAAHKLYEQEEWETAIQAYTSLLEMHLEYPDRDTAQFRLGRSYEYTSAFEKAVGTYKSLLNEAPDSSVAAESHYRLGCILLEQENASEATIHLEKAAESGAGEHAARARFQLGEIYESQGNHELAARHFMRVGILYFHPELTPRALWRAGQAFEKAQDKIQAIKTYEEIINDYPDSAEAPKARERVNTLHPA